MTAFTPYLHTVQYYETDAMGITHHSNYIRWFEEARTDLLLQAGYSYARMEESGAFSPVLSVNVQYKRMTRFQEQVQIDATITEYNGVRMQVNYVVHYPGQEEVLCEGYSTHCFVTSSGRPVSMRKFNPEIDTLLKGLLTMAQEPQA